MNSWRQALLRLCALPSGGVARRLLLEGLVRDAVLAASLAAAFVAMQHHALREDMQLRAAAVVELVASQSQLGLLVDDRKALQAVAAAAVETEDVLYARIEDARGATLAQACSPGFPAAQIPAGPRVQRGEVATRTMGGLWSAKAFVEAARSVSLRTDDALLEWEAHKSGSRRVGAARVGLSTERQRAQLARVLRQTLAIAVIALLLAQLVQHLQIRKLLRLRSPSPMRPGS